MPSLNRHKINAFVYTYIKSTYSLFDGRMVDGEVLLGYVIYYSGQQSRGRRTTNDERRNENRNEVHSILKSLTSTVHLKRNMLLLTLIGLCFIITSTCGFSVQTHNRLQPATIGGARSSASRVSLLRLQRPTNKEEDNFDPDQVLKDNDEGQPQNPISLWFANLIKNDYELAESFFAAAFISTMVIISQELLRMQMYGDHYIPFSKGSSPGSLF
jgi:hypothetical protein